MAHGQGSGPRPEHETSTNAALPGGTNKRRRWQPDKAQTLLVAVIGAIATIVAALIGIVPHGDDSGPSAPGETPRPATSAAPVLAITSWTEDELPPHGRSFTFAGTVRGVGSGDFAVYVVAQTAPVRATEPVPVLSSPTGRHPSPPVVYQEHWLVSPPARLESDGSWRVERWDVPDPPRHAHWLAVVQLTGRVPDNRDPSLESNGPDAGGVVATATPRPH
ncbi:hypothetical protein GCM10023191_035370 [Actinoallomurus oryzae]|uniref:Uncharacterized protein n=1 Tax=Actinoallomurus oryzae TaxID=502180 RepID=A0ABP8Q053_9ACTN